jgi:peptidyl-prolyl cis-trans isomerase D
MRRHARSWLIKIVFVVIIIVFVFWGVGSFRSRRARVLAYVNGDPIYYQQFATVYRQVIESYRNRFKDFNEEWIKKLNLKQTVLNQLIERKLLLQEAKKTGLIVTDMELWQSINQLFQKKGQFDPRWYKEILARYHYTPEQFEDSLRQDLIISKLTNIIQSLAHVSDVESYETYRWLNQKINLEFAVFDPKDFEKKIKLDKKAMKNYFAKHKNDYLIPRQLKLAYVKISFSDFLKEIKLSNEEVNKYYEANKEMFFEPKKVCARHILFHVPQKASQAEIKRLQKQAEAVLAKVKKGKAFAKLASKYSEDKATAKRGGDLGCFPRGKMIKPFEKVAFSLKKDRVSDLVRTEFGFHIIKVYDIKEERIKPFTEVKNQILKTLKQEKAKEKALEFANRIYAQGVLENDLNVGAKKYKKITEETDYFSKAKWSPKLPWQLREQILSLKKGEFSAPLEVLKGYLLVQIKDEKSERIPSFNEVEDKIKTKWIMEETEKKARERAEEMLNLIQKEEIISSNHQRKFQETGFFSLQTTIPKVAFAPRVKGDLFLLTLKQPYLKYVPEIKNKFYIFKLKARQVPSKAKYEKDKKNFKKNLLTKQRLAIFNAWVEALRQSSKIKIRKEMLR